MADTETPEIEEDSTDVVLDLHILGSDAGEIHTVAFMPDTLKALLDFDFEDGQQKLSVIASVPADSVRERYELLVEALREALVMLADPAVVESLPSDEPETIDPDAS